MREEPAWTGQDLLYHYTDQHGLLGIIERRELWATSLGCLNDLSEFSHGLDYLRSVRDQLIDDLAGQRPGNNPEDKNFKAVFGCLLDEAQRRYGQIDPAEYLFVFSLFHSNQHLSSTTLRHDPGDNLEQWRAYSKGGLGYCIGFDKMLLESKVNELNERLQRTFCGECMYDEVEKYIKAKGIFQALVPACELALAKAYAQKRSGQEAPASEPENPGQDLKSLGRIQETVVPAAPSHEPSRSEARELISGALSTYFGRVLINSALMKHAAFATEREWRAVRLAFVSSEEINFRPTSRGIVPYTVIPITENENSERIIPGLIKRIVIGPLGNTSHGAKARAASIMKMLLESNGIGVASGRDELGASVENSKLPC